MKPNMIQNPTRDQAITTHRTRTRTPKRRLTWSLGWWALVGGMLMAGGLALPAQGSVLAPTAEFVGRDGNWFEPANWSTGRVPDASTDVRIDGDAQVVIDPARGTREVAVRDISVGDQAQLTTLAGTILRTRHEVLGGSGRIVHRSTESYAESLSVAPAPSGPRCVNCGIMFNPTPKSIRIVDLQSSVTIDMGLGGTAAAGPGQVGPGHYATISAETVALDGDLRTSLLYGFSPSPGDRFQVITAGRLTGRFRGLPEGGVVASYPDVLLRISYEGGDGNDVVLYAQGQRPIISETPPDPTAGGSGDTRPVIIGPPPAPVPGTGSG
jgi:hypothetical protein